MNDNCFYRNDNFITFSMFCQRVSIARAAVRKVSCNKVLLFDTDSYQFAIWLFALILEKKHVLLPPNAQAGTLSQLAQECEATAGSIKVANKSQIIDSKIDSTIDVAEYTREQLFELFNGEITFFTSGSTGHAKAIKKSCQQLVLEIDTLKSEFSAMLAPANFIVSTVSHQHIYGLLFKILLPLRLGKSVINQTFEYPEHICQLLGELSASTILQQKGRLILVSSPAHLQRLVQDNVLMANSAHFSGIFSSGGLLSRASSQALLQQMKISPTEVYGSTETGGIAWRCGQNSAEEPWQVFANIKITVSDDRQRLEVFSPYVNEQPYITDDYVELLDTQRFLLKGRIDRTVKVEEKRVNLSHIERHLVQHHLVAEARVIVTNNNSASGRKILAAAVILTDKGQVFINKQGKLALNNVLKLHLLSEVERICLPKKWRYLLEYPYNSQGKLVLSDLEKLFD